jgi:hypothetical protein
MHHSKQKRTKRVIIDDEEDKDGDVMVVLKRSCPKWNEESKLSNDDDSCL